jgi:beta-galactosidase
MPQDQTPPAWNWPRIRVEIFLRRRPRRAAASFADGSWRTVNLPHDWSIENPPDKATRRAQEGAFSQVRRWYRKTLLPLPIGRGKRVSIEFDGVYRKRTVFLNGHKLGDHPYGYTAFTFDLTPSSILN